MKRRITALILVIVMLALSLVSCGYSLAKDDLSAYATFSAEDANFKKLLEKIKIEDGKFTAFDSDKGTSAEIRARLVLENIYSALASKADKTDKLTEGAIGAHDLLYYCYYVTAPIVDKDSGKTNTEYFFMSEMKEANADSVQLGIIDTEDEVATAIREAIKNFTFSADNAYTSPTSGTVAKGDVVFVTYKYSYKGTVEKDGKEVEQEISDTITNEMVVVSDDVNVFAGRLNGKNVNSTIESFDLNETRDGKEDVKVTYSGVKINWVGKGGELTSFTDTTYDEEKKQTNTAGDSRDLKDIELTYHIYPVSYVKVEEFTALNVVNTLLGSSISTSSMYEILFGSDYVGLHEDHSGHSHTEEEKKENDEKLAELNEWLKAYETKDEDGKTVTLEDLLTSIAKLQSTYSDTKKEYDEAEDDLETKDKTLKDKTDDYNEKKKIVEDAGDKATDAQKTALTKAETAMKSAQTTRDSSKKEFDSAKEKYDKDLKSRDDEVAKLMAIEGIADKITKGYRVKTYNSLQTAYNTEIKQNLAKEIYFFLTETVKVTGAPEELVESAYESLYENYEYKFYKEMFDSTKKITNYKQYDGSFKNYLVATVTNDIKKVANYKEAIAALKAEALDQMMPIVRMYVVAKALGDDVFVSDSDWKAFKKDTDSDYYIYRYGPYGIQDYGETNARYAYQFDQLLNYYLEIEEHNEEDEVEDANGYTLIKDTYKKIGFEIGDPASEAEDEKEDSTEN